MREKIWLVVAMTMMMVGCGTQMPIVTEKNDTMYVDRFRVDSVYLADSVFMTIYEKGDTIYSEKTKTRYRDRFVYKVDSIYIARTDTIRVPMPVERKLSAFESIKKDFGEVIRLVSVVLCTAFILWFIGLLRRKK